MPIDIAADVKRILGDCADFKRTTGTWSDGTNSQAIRGIFFNRAFAPDPDSALDVSVGTLVVERTRFNTVARPAAGHTWTVTGERVWDCDEVLARVEYFALTMTRRLQRGASK